ncbi:hypothetical protein ABK040_000233 [Willaertia magna]
MPPKKKTVTSTKKKNQNKDDDMSFLLEMQKQNEKQVKLTTTTVGNNKKIETVNKLTPKEWPLEQTKPTVPIKYLFKDEKFPSGEIHSYKKNEQNKTVPATTILLDNNNKATIETTTSRYHSLELRPGAEEREEKIQETLKEARHAAEVHRTARKWFKEHVVKPGMKVINAAEAFENKARELLEADKFKSGIAFPLGCSINYVAAHYTPNPGDVTIIGKDDIIKFDLGVQYKGTIIDSAFTVYWNDMFQPLAEAAREATNAGVAFAGIGVRLGDVGAAIQEVMEFYEVEIKGKIYRVRSIRTLGGHSIERYRVHADKCVPTIACDDDTKMEEGEFFAIETFGSTGRGQITEEGVVSHYGKNFDYKGDGSELRNPEAKQLLRVINEQFGTLPFCKRYLDRVGQKKYLTALRDLVSNGIVNEYPPFVDLRGSYTSQFEHTIFLRPTCKEVLSRGDDY